MLAAEPCLLASDANGLCPSAIGVNGQAYYFLLNYHSLTHDKLPLPDSIYGRYMLCRP